MSVTARLRGQVCQICGERGNSGRPVQVVDSLPAHKSCRPKRICSRPRCSEPEHASQLCRPHYNKAYYQRDQVGHRERARLWALENADRVVTRNLGRDKADLAARSRAWYRANRMRALATQHNARARRLGAEGIVTPEQLLGRLSYYGHRCYLCGGSPNGFDHVKPLAAGGPHLAANLRPVCGSCNSTKGQSWKDAV